MRTFRFSKGRSDKTWSIGVEGKSTIVEFGRTGSDLRRLKKPFASPAAAQTEMVKLIVEKTGKGYVEVRGMEEATASPDAEESTKQAPKTNAERSTEKPHTRAPSKPSARVAPKESVVALPAKLKKAIEKQFPDAAAAIEAHCLPSIRLSLKDANDQSIPVGKTKVGGLPDLPNGCAWPTLEVRIPPQSSLFQKRHPTNRLPGDTPIPYTFMAQIDLREAARFDVEGLLPRKGLLSFFFCPEVFQSDGKSRKGDWKQLTKSPDGTNTYLAGAKSACVLFFEDASKLERAAAAESSPAQSYKIVTIASKVTLSSEVTLPQVESPYVGDSDASVGSAGGEPVMLGADDYEAYHAFTSDMERHHKVCQMLGHADQVQPNVLENQFRDVQKELFPEIERSIGYGDPFHRGSRLLLQLSSGADNPFYFFAREDDLRGGDFSRVWGIQVRG